MNKNISKAVVYLVCLLTVLAALSLRDIRFEVNPDGLLQSTNVDYKFYTAFREKFQTDTDYDVMIVGLKNFKGIFQKDFLEKTDSLTKFITKLEHIQKVYSLTTSNLIYFNDGQFNARPLIHVTQPEFYVQDSAYLFQSREYRDLLVSEDGHSIAIVAFNAQHLMGIEKDKLLRSIRDEINKIGFDESHLAAKIRIEQVLVSEIKANLKKFFLLLSLLIGFLILFFRRASKSIVLTTIIAISIVWMLAIFSFSDKSLNMVTMMLPLILVTFYLPNVIFLVNKYMSVLNRGPSSYQDFKTTFYEVGQTALFSSLAKSMVFFTLIFSPYSALREFSLLAIVGTIIPLLLTVILIPAYFGAWPMPNETLESTSKYHWNIKLTQFIELVHRNKYKVILLCSLATIISGYFCTHLEVNETNLDKIPKGSALLDDYNFMEKEFYGTRSFELSLMTNKSSKTFFDNSLLKQVEEIEKFLKDSCHVSYIISPISLIKGANKAYHGGNIADFKLPASQAETTTYAENIMQTQYADELQRHIVQDGSELRISGKLPDLSIKEFEKLSTRFEQYFKRKSYSESFNYTITGPSFLMDKFMVHLTKSLLLGLILALFLSACFNFYLYRSCSVTFITMIPALLTIVVTSGIMGLFHIDINTGTVLILILSFSVMIDFSLYFIHYFKLKVKSL